MTLRSRRLLQLGGLALLVALAVGFALTLAHRPSGARVDLGGRAVSVRQELTPRDPQFGDTVVATIDVFADPSRVDAGSIQVKAGFGPYTVASSSRTVRTIGGVWVIRVERRLRCLDLPCVPTGNVKAFRFEPVRVSYREGSRTHVVASPSPALRAHSRVTAAELARPVLRVPAPVAAPDRYRLPPTATGYALLALAALLAAGPIPPPSDRDGVRAACARRPARRRWRLPSARGRAPADRSCAASCGTPRARAR